MRKLYIDNIRWITVVVVVIYHVIYMFNGVQTLGVIGPLSKGVQYQDLFQYIVYPWFMVLLFVISGMSARFYLEKHSHKEFLRSRTRKLLVPSTVGLFVFQWITGYFNMMIGGAFETMGQVPKPVLFLIMCLSGTGALWFVQLLWFFSVLLVLVRILEKDRLYHMGERAGILFLVGLGALIWASAQVLNTPVIVVYRFGIYGVSFFLGYFVLSHDAVMERLSKKWIPLCLAALVLMVVFCFTYWQKEVYTDPVVLESLLCNAYAWIMVLAILAFMKRYGNFDTAFVRFMKQQSWGLYVFHYLPLAAGAWYLYGFSGKIPDVCLYLLTAAAAFGGSYLLNALIRRIPVMRWCVLGIRVKE